MTPTVLLIAEQSQGDLASQSGELAGFARVLAEMTRCTPLALLLGQEASSRGLKLAQATGLDVVAVHVPGMSTYNSEAYKGILQEMVPQLNASYVCMAHTSQAADYAPGLAVRLQAACITAVERLVKDRDRIVFARGILGGKWEAHVASNTTTTVLTVQPGAFRPVSGSGVGRVKHVSLSFAPRSVRSMGGRQERRADAHLDVAKTIISAGRGIGKQDNLEILHQLARMFPNSGIAGSRPVCDLGWLDYSRQVGMTGSTVSPELYLACGISGTVQHTAGMRQSKFIVAVNTDPAAAIFQMADVCVVEDVRVFVPALVEALKNELRRRE